MQNNDEIAKVAALIKDAEIAMITTLSADNRLVSRPMTVQEAEFDGDLWFIFSEDSEQAADIRDDAEVNVSLQSKGTWISVAGTARIVHDDAKLREFWSAGVDAWFPEGPDSPGIALLKVEGESAQYWTAKAGPVRTLVELVKSRVRDTRPDIGETNTVEL